MTELLRACWVCPEYPAKPLKRRLRRGPAMRVWVVVTRDRFFTFTDLARAETFARRARRLPSMFGVAIEMVSTVTNGSLRKPGAK